MKNLFFFFFLLPTVLNAQPIIISVAGTGISGYTGDGGLVLSARIISGNSVCDAAGNYYFAQRFQNVVRKVNISTGVITTIAGNGSAGYSGDLGPATAAQLNNPAGVAFDTAGNLYISEVTNNRIRKVDMNTGVITTFAGIDTGGTTAFSGDGGLAINAAIGTPEYMCTDVNDNLYVICAEDRVRKININTGIITTVAGNGVPGFGGDGGRADSAELQGVYNICTDRFGHYLYIADENNHRVRRVNLTTNIINSIAGNGNYIYSGDSLLADTSGIDPRALAIDDTGNLYVADNHDERIVKIDTFGITHTIAGTGVYGFSGDCGPATSAKIWGVEGLHFDLDHNLWIDDFGNNRIRKVIFYRQPDTANITISSSLGDTVGAGTPVTFYPTVSGGTPVAYRWYRNGVATGTSGISYSYTPSNGDSIQCTVTIGSTCPGADSARSNVIHIIVNPVLTPSVTITASSSYTVCAGTSVTYSASIANGGTIPGYQWRVNGSDAGTGSAYTYTPGNGDSIRCVLTSSYSCPSVSSVSSNMINMVVNPVLTPSVTISASSSYTVCAGTAVTYSSIIANAGASPGYQWKVNGSNVGTGSTYTYTPGNGDSIRCVLTSSYSCPSVSSVSSNTIHMVVNPILTPSITVSASSSYTVCAGTSITYSSVISNGGASPGYQWKVNGSNVGTGSSYTYTPNNGDSIRCLLTSSYSCPSPTSVTSSIIHMTVNPVLTPSVTISASSSYTICAGTSVTYSSVIAYGGTSPGYQWKVNGSNVGTGSSYTYTPNNGDSILCVFTSSVACPSPTSVSSNIIHMAVTPLLTPTVTIAGVLPDTICAGWQVKYIATASGAGSSVGYDWFVNGVSVSTTTGSEYLFSPLNGDSISCVVTPGVPCSGPASSNTIHIVAIPVIVASVSVTGPVAATLGTVVTVNAAISGAGSSYDLHWMNHGILFATTTVNYTTYTKGVGVDIITADVVPTGVGCYDTTASLGWLVNDASTEIPVLFSQENELTIYPNPAHNSLTLSLSKVEGTRIEICNLLGQTLLSKEATSELINIDIESLLPGVYFIKITDNDGQKTVRKFVKE